MLHNSATVTISDKWQVVLPKSVRKHLKIRTRDKVIVQPISETEVNLKIVSDPVEYGVGFLSRNNPEKVTMKKLLHEKYEDIKLEDK